MPASFNLSHLYKQHSMDPEDSKNPTRPLVDTEPLPVLLAGQDTNHHKHKLFDLVSGFKKGGCGDITGEEQLPPLLTHMTIKCGWQLKALLMSQGMPRCCGEEAQRMLLTC